MCSPHGVLFPLKQLTRLFKALSDATRFRLVSVLHVRSLGVGELQEVLGVPQSVVSRQLSILHAARLVTKRRHGLRVRYSLARAPLLNYPLTTFIEEVRSFFPELRADAIKLIELKGNSSSD